MIIKYAKCKNDIVTFSTIIETVDLNVSCLLFLLKMKPVIWVQKSYWNVK